MRATALVLLTCVGCGKSHDAPPPASGSAAGSAGSGSAVTTAGNIKVTIDQKPLLVEHAFIKRLPDGRAQLYLGEGGSCEQLMSNVFDGRNPHVLIDVITYLLADGTTTRGIGDVYTGPPAKSDPQSKVTITGELAKGSKVQITLRTKSTEAKLAAEGDVTAESCGDQDEPAPAAAGAATMTIALTPFVIRAALKRGDDIELTDQPRDCQSAQYIGLRLKREGGTWHLDGTRMPVELTGPAPALTVKPAPVKESPGPGHVMMTLGGSDKVAAYPVALEGVVDMVDCNFTPPK